MHLVSAQECLPIEKQITCWRQEVFKLLLSNKQAESAFSNQAVAHAEAQTKLEQQLASAQAGILLLQGRLVDRQVSSQSHNMLG